MYAKIEQRSKTSSVISRHCQRLANYIALKKMHEYDIAIERVLLLRRSFRLEYIKADFRAPLNMMSSLLFCSKETAYSVECVGERRVISPIMKNGP